MLLFHAVLSKLITLVVIATGQTFQFSWFLQLPSSNLPYPTELEQLLKYQLGCELPLLPTLHCELPFL